MPHPPIKVQERGIDLTSAVIAAKIVPGAMTASDEDYLRPSWLCDFDRCPQIMARALELTLDCRSRAEIYKSLFAFVKELPYGLDDWDVPASETLSKGWGMCSGKTNLLVALLRPLSIPARYRIFRIRGERSLWERITSDEELWRRMGDAPLEQDHVECEVWLGGWIACDPSRDTPLERGLLALGIPLEREPVLNASGGVPYLFLASFDDWARGRQEGRRFRENRDKTFAAVNESLQHIRALGGGICPSG